MSNRGRSVVSAAVSAALLSSSLVIPLAALAAETGPAPQQDNSQLEEIVVTGFRGSLNTALAEKRAETGSIDVIAAEDIGKFPDSNLAESMQRIPGVTLSRGDGGEGRNISVRGLGPLFTRVRVNGMEAAAQAGSSDIYGAGNNGRSFDFNVFPTEIFSQLAVRKTPSADVEEGSLGATVDLKAPRPFDFAQDRVFSLTGRGVFNTISEDLDPRASMLFSQKFFDNTFGVLASAAFQKRNIREVGYSAVDVLSANTNGNNIGTSAAPILLPYCTPIGWTATGPSPVTGSRGSTASNCSALTPRSSNLAAFNTVYNMRRADAPNTPGSGAFLPRLPRYVNSEQDTERTGGTLTLQWKPNENTDIALDGLLSRYQVERRDNYILGLSFGRSLTNNGQPMVAVKDISFDKNGSLEYAVFDGVDVRSEGLVDQFVSTFEQANLTFEHRFNDSFKISGLAGRSNSIWDGPMRLQTYMDHIDAQNFTLDFRGGRETPLIGFGIDVNDPASFQYAPTPDGNQTVLGGFSTQGKPSRNVTQIANFDLAGEWQATDQIALTLGGQYRENDFHSRNSNLVPSQAATLALPNGVTLADLTRRITGLNDSFGSGAPASWVAIDSKKWREVFNFADMDFCEVECGAAQSQILEKVTSGFFMFKFDSGRDWRFPVRGDIGVRYVKTDQSAVGYIPVVAPAGAPFQAVGQRNQVDREYSDTLPSLNVVVDLTPDLLARFSASKVMSRPELGNLTPTATITATTRTGTVNNPFLDPIRAKTADVALEWYFRPGSLLSAAYFYKDIETYIQRITSPIVYTELGLPDSLLAGTPTLPSEIFNVSRLENTKGGPLKGFELNAQLQLDMLPGMWSHFGVLANYTRVESEIQYILTSVGGVITSSTTADLVGLSKNSASGTLFYDDGTFSIRTTGTFRDKYIRGIPASAGSDLQGNGETFYLDAAASWNFNDYLTVILEAQNLTEERNTLFIDSTREDTLFQTDIGRTYTLGATIKF
ncbi:TonB-dependent receptor [Peristeroidobacter soli]|uniref:TonB-dependent receptor n=1 Tax=Peristeroidobacter soli TaxID=2497877 RepID=UPI00101D2D7C